MQEPFFIMMPAEPRASVLERQNDSFRDTVCEPDDPPPEEGRCHLYVSLGCPWSHRTLMTRALLGPNGRVGAGIADPEGPDLFPQDLAADQEALDEFLHHHLECGVHRAGFATDQAVYEAAVRDVFLALDGMAVRLAQSTFLLGEQLVESDLRLFCMLIRFDQVYHGHFKCNLRQIIDYPPRLRFMTDFYQHPGVAATVHFEWAHRGTRGYQERARSHSRRSSRSAGLAMCSSKPASFARRRSSSLPYPVIATRKTFSIPGIARTRRATW
jgi:glutathionyl-hydroquinone reductase